MTEVPLIAALKPVPQRTDAEADFDQIADEFFDDLPRLRTEMNAQATGMNSSRSETDGFKGDAETARDLAQKYANEDEDTEVASGEYSAKHFAAKAEADRIQTGLDRTQTGTDAASANVAAVLAGDATGLDLSSFDEGDVVKVGAGDTLTAGPSGYTKTAEYEITTPVASLEIELPSSGDEFLVIFSEFSGASDGASILLRTSSDGGSTFDTTSAYRSGWVALRASSNSAPLGDYTNGAATSMTMVSNIDVAGVGISGDLRVMGAATGMRTKMSWSISGAAAGVPFAQTLGGGMRESDDLTDAIQIRFSSGNISSGTVRVISLI